jgi:hypothetical protein
MLQTSFVGIRTAAVKILIDVVDICIVVTLITAQRIFQAMYRNLMITKPAAWVGDVRTRTETHVAIESQRAIP